MGDKKTGAKGFTLEEALRSSFQRAGYLVLGGLPFRIEGEDVTDVDLWLYERPVASSRRRLIVDVRNRKSPKAAERLIWTRGLMAALRVDGAMVATTDRRPATRRLAKSLGLTLLDKDTMDQLTKVVDPGQAPLSWSEFNAIVKKVDDARRSSDWRDALFDAQGSMLSGFGIQSGNTALSTFEYFAQQAVQAHPGSPPSMMANRLACLMGAFALISLDFLMADHSMRSADDRRAVILNSIRYGQAEVAPSLASVRAAIGLARKYAENGNAIASQIELGFRNEADQIPADIIADFVLRAEHPHTLFETARELEDAATRRGSSSFDSLSIEARAALGAFLDYSGVSREKFANASKGGALANAPSVQPPASKDPDAGPLFDETASVPK